MLGIHLQIYSHALKKDSIIPKLVAVKPELEQNRDINKYFSSTNTLENNKQNNIKENNITVENIFSKRN